MNMNMQLFMIILLENVLNFILLYYIQVFIIFNILNLKINLYL